MKTVLFASLFACGSALAIPSVPATLISVAKGPKGTVLRLEDAQSPEGGSALSFQIVGKNQKVLKEFVVSNTQFNASASNGDAHAEKISEKACRSNLGDLQSEIHKRMFKKVKVNLEACGGKRRDAVTKN